MGCMIQLSYVYIFTTKYGALKASKNFYCYLFTVSVAGRHFANYTSNRDDRTDGAGDLPIDNWYLLSLAVKAYALFWFIRWLRYRGIECPIVTMINVRLTWKNYLPR